MSWGIERERRKVLHQERGEIRKGQLPILFVILFKSTDEVGDPGDERGRAAELHRSHDRP